MRTKKKQITDTGSIQCNTFSAEANIVITGVPKSNDYYFNKREEIYFDSKLKPVKNNN